jgi:hypothetical protein
MWWNDVLKMVVEVVVEGCLMPPSGVELLAINLVCQISSAIRIQFGISVRQFDLAIQFGNLIWHLSSALKFGT